MKKYIIFTVIVLVSVLATGFAFNAKGPYLKDPAKTAVWLLTFHLDLTEAQQSEMRGIIKPVVEELISKRKANMTKVPELLAKIENGTLKEADITERMEKRREFAAANQEKIAQTVIKVFNVLNESQRKLLSSRLQEKFNQFVD